jgi:hypothetical protein
MFVFILFYNIIWPLVTENTLEMDIVYPSRCKCRTICLFVSHISLVVLGCLMVIMLAIGPKVREFNAGRGRSIFKGDKICRTTSFGGEIKPSSPRREILLHVKEPYGLWKRYFADKINGHLTLLRYYVSLTVFIRAFWWINHKLLHIYF